MHFNDITSLVSSSARCSINTAVYALNFKESGGACMQPQNWIFISLNNHNQQYESIMLQLCFKEVLYANAPFRITVRNF